VQALERQHRPAVGVRKREAADVEVEREGIEMDCADAEGATVVVTDEILSVLAREIGYGEKADGGIRADQHEDDGKRDEVAPIPVHAPRSVVVMRANPRVSTLLSPC